MKPTRRSFFGLLAAAPVAAKEMLPEALQQGMDSYFIDKSYGIDATDEPGMYAKDTSWLDEVNSLAKRLLDVEG